MTLAISRSHRSQGGSTFVAQTRSKPMNKQPMRVFALCCMLTVSLCFVVGGLVLTTSDKDTTKRDFIEYWEAGQQFVHGANPYDVTAALQLERAVGLEGEHPRVSW